MIIERCLVVDRQSGEGFRAAIVDFYSRLRRSGHAFMALRDQQATESEVLLRRLNRSPCITIVEMNEYYAQLMMTCRTLNL